MILNHYPLNILFSHHILILKGYITHVSLAFLLDIGKQCLPRSDENPDQGLYHVLTEFSTGPRSESVTCLVTDACLTADPGVASSILARYHTFVEIDHEIISTVILLPSADLFKKGCCQLQEKVCAQITG